MGGGVGLSAHGRHRVVTERTKLAMPEVGLGFFPDVGGTWLLSHSPGEIGTYFGLTGQTMNGPDAIHAKFADAVVSSSKLPALREALTKVASGATSADIRTLIDGFSTGETAGPVAAMQAKIDALFFHDRMEDIVGALQRDGSDIALATLKTLNEKSQAEDSRWQISHSLGSATWAGRWRPIWSRPATRSPRSIWWQPRAIRPRPTAPASLRVRSLPSRARMS